MSEGLARNTLYSSIAGLIYSLGRFFTTVVLARTVGVHDTGVVNYVLWLVALVGSLTDMGAYATLSRFLPEVAREDVENNEKSLASYLFWPFAALALIPPLGLIAAVASGLSGQLLALAGEFEAGANLLLVVALLYWVQVLSNFALGYLQGMQQFRRMVVFAAVAMSIQILVVGAGGLLWGAQGALLGYILGCAVPAGLCVGFLRAWRPLSGEMRKRVHRFALYSWAGTVASALVWGRLETAFLNHYRGSEAVGLYSVGYTLASLAVQAPILLTGALLPYFSEIAAARDRRKMEAGLQTGTRFLVFVTLPLTFVTAALVPQLLTLIFGPAFAAASHACAILVIGTGLWACSSVAINALAGLERSDFIFFAHLSGAVLSVLLSVLLIPALGINGAALTRAAAQIYVLALTWWFVCRRMGFKLPTAESLSLLAASAASGLLAFLVANMIAGPAAIAAAALAGAGFYVLSVRLLHAIPDHDVAIMRSAIERLPAPLKPLLQLSLTLIAPAARR